MSGHLEGASELLYKNFISDVQFRVNNYRFAAHEVNMPPGAVGITLVLDVCAF